MYFILLNTTITNSSDGGAGECSLLVRSDICWSLVQIRLGGMWCFFVKMLAVLLIIELNNV